MVSEKNLVNMIMAHGMPLVTNVEHNKQIKAYMLDISALPINIEFWKLSSKPTHVCLVFKANGEFALEFVRIVHSIKGNAIQIPIFGVEFYQDIDGYTKTTLGYYYRIMRDMSIKKGDTIYSNDDYTFLDYIEEMLQGTYGWC